MKRFVIILLATLLWLPLVKFSFGAETSSRNGVAEESVRGKENRVDVATDNGVAQAAVIQTFLNSHGRDLVAIDSRSLSEGVNHSELTFRAD